MALMRCFSFLLLTGCNLCDVDPPKRGAEPTQGIHGLVAGRSPVFAENGGWCDPQPPGLAGLNICARADGRPDVCTQAGPLGDYTLELAPGTWTVCVDIWGCAPPVSVGPGEARVVDLCACIWSIDEAEPTCFGANECRDDAPWPPEPLPDAGPLRWVVVVDYWEGNEEGAAGADICGVSAIVGDTPVAAEAAYLTPGEDVPPTADARAALDDGTECRLDHDIAVSLGLGGYLSVRLARPLERGSTVRVVEHVSAVSESFEVYLCDGPDWWAICPGEGMAPEGGTVEVTLP